MTHPLIKLATITFTTLILGSGALFYLRQSGLGRGNQPITADFLQPGVQILHGGDSAAGPTHSLASLQATHNKNNAINMISLQRTKDGHHILYPFELLEKATDGNGPVFLHTLEELKKLTLLSPKSDKPHQLISFVEYLESFKGEPVIINLFDRDPAKAYGLEKQLVPYDLQGKVVFHSQYSSNLKTLRKYLPRAIYSINSQAILRTRVFAALYIEPIAPLQGDIVIAPLKSYDSKPLFSESIITELRRRNIPIIIEGPGELTEDEWLELKPLSKIIEPKL